MLMKFAYLRVVFRNMPEIIAGCQSIAFPNYLGATDGIYLNTVCSLNKIRNMLSARSIVPLFYDAW